MPGPLKGSVQQRKGTKTGPLSTSVPTKTSHGRLFTRDRGVDLSFFSCKNCQQSQQIINSLRVGLQDLFELQLRRDREVMEERKALLDRIQSLSNPPSLREFRRDNPEVVERVSRQAPATLHFPGFRPSTRPPLDPDRLAALKK